jgi:predicted Fe-Mo cluster-binding NifX family protein
LKVVIATKGGLEGETATHFGHCSHFIVIDAENGKAVNTSVKKKPLFPKTYSRSTS